jgi:uncharacterized membrane protein
MMRGGTHDARCEPEAGSDSGQVMLLIIVYAAIALSLILVVFSASSVHLDRKRLFAVADAAALDAADDLDRGGYFDRGVTSGDGVPLSDASVRASVEQYLAGHPTSLHDVTIVSATSPDGRTAQVTLSAPSRLPFTAGVLDEWSDGVLLQVTSSSRAPLT